MFHREEFNEADLVKIDTSKCVVLASGGPLMDVLSVDDGEALCRWTDEEGKINAARFNTACLRRLIMW